MADDYVMIMSLGGSTMPLIESIRENKPGKIIFFASHQSIPLSGEVLRGFDPKPKHFFEITDDPNLMFKCYQAARRCMDRLKELGVPAEQVIVDYTGGTKVMTAALVLATVGESFRFNYVGGGVRTKDGLGLVLNGHEKMYVEMNPWSVFAEEERRQIVTLFNGRRYSAVMKIVEMCHREVPGEIRDFFRFIQPLAEGFLLWEQFQHQGAFRKIGEGMESLADHLIRHPRNNLEHFREGVTSCHDFLRRLLANTESMKKKDHLLVTDLLNNARRRMMDYRFDDAAARIYRALELYGQILFEEFTGCENNRVKREIVPETIREEFIRKYEDPSKHLLKLPLTATFEFLEASSHEAGHRYFQRIDEIKKVQFNRNDSILAHGIRPIHEPAIQSVWQVVTDFVGFDEILDFPLLPG